MPETEDLIELARTVRRDVIEMVCSAGSGHPGGSLSVVEILVTLFFDRMRLDVERPHQEERDRFVLSKGHACPALYSVLARRGFFEPSELLTLRSLGSRLQGHPDMRKLPFLEASTGSLGHGLGISVGLARGLRLKGLDKRVYCLMGDGELQEGSIWESAMTAAHHRLGNLVAVVDRNRVQLDGRVETVMDVEPLRDKWLAFGWNVAEADGHDFDSLGEGFRRCESENSPGVLIAHTVKGKGVSFMEDTCLWHGACPDGDQRKAALREIGGAENAR
ncbi:transketolase [Candidatus Fermentibacteria bacterium]|nr:transketolase [Candidatus Fermentibacteria bacterium]